MNIEQNKNGNQLNVNVEGRLDINTSPLLEKTLVNSMDEEIETVIFDFENLEYISSSGLRVILFVLKQPGKVKRSVIIKNPNSRIREILYATGFDDLVDIQGNEQ